MKASGMTAKILRFFWGIFPWLLVLLTVAFVGFMGEGIMQEQERVAEAKKAAMAKKIPRTKVITLTLNPRRIEDKIVLPGQVEPFEELWVKAQVPGQAVEILAKEGQTVKRGQLLVRLDDRDYRARLERVEANYRLARLDYRRISTLAREKITPENKLDEAAARLKELSARLKEAQLALSRTRIKAPVDGILNEMKAKKGELVEANHPVAQILQIEKVKVTVGVPESDVAAFFRLQEADVIIEALGNRKVRGKKVFLARKPRTLARLYDLELELPNPDRSILPGMFAQVVLIKKVFDQALTVPLYAVISQGEDRFVYVVEKGRAQKRKIELGILVDWQVQIRSGLKPGDQVIIVGHRLLDSGQEVQVVKNVLDASEILKS